MAGPALQIQPPVRQRREGGIEEVADFRLNSRLASVGGVTFQSDGCTFPQLSEHLCYVGEADPAEKTFDGIDLIDGIGDPFPLYAGVKCFIGPDDDFAERAERSLSDGRHVELEKAVATWAAGGTALADGATQAEATARVEQAISAGYNGQGVILMSAFDAIMADAQGILYRDSAGQIRTILGTPVLASGSIEAGSVYGVGAIAVEHSAVQTQQVENLDTNTNWALAEQVFAIAVDCGFRVTSDIVAEVVAEPNVEE